MHNDSTKKDEHHAWEPTVGVQTCRNVWRGIVLFQKFKFNSTQVKFGLARAAQEKIFNGKINSVATS